MILDQTFTIALLKAAQKAVNKALHYDPGTQKQLSKLQGKLLHIICKSPNFDCFVQFYEHEVELLSQSELEPDCEISASASALWNYLNQPTHSLANSGVKVSGDIALLTHLQKIMQDLDIDWETALIDNFGETGGHLFAKLLRSQVSAFKQTKQHATDWLPEYLSEELRVTPHRLELDFFYQQVQSVSSDVARLEKRFQKLRQSLSSRPLNGNTANKNKTAKDTNLD